MIYTPEQEAKIDTLLTEMNVQADKLAASKGTPQEPIIKADLTATIKSLNVALDEATKATTGLVMAIDNNQVTNKTNI